MAKRHEAGRIDRRQLLRAGGALALVGAGCGRGRGHDPAPATGTGPEAPAASAASAGTDGAATGDALDEVLAFLHKREPLSKQGLSTHAPMVAETLDALGRGEHALRWVEDHRAPILEIPQPRQKIEPERWRAALGPKPGASSWEQSLPRWGDWREYFLDQLAEGSWPELLDLWVSRLAPGISAAATHGVIRTAHAVRALSRRETPTRRAELARGLAYWAAAYEELPAAASRRPPPPSYRAALARLPLHTEVHGSAPRGSIVDGLRAVGGLDGFGVARDIMPVPADLGDVLSELTATFARIYLQHGTRQHTIAFVHAVTAPCALRRIAPHIRPETARAAFPFVWQAAAGIYSAYAWRDDVSAARPFAPSKLAPAELTARAIDNGADHAIKFAEALVSENAIQPDPVYLAAAEDISRRL
jgi:hypothetical protein